MKNKNNNLRNTLLLISAAAAFLLLADVLINKYFNDKELSASRQAVTACLNDLSKTLQSKVEQNLSLLGGLTAYVSQDPDVLEQEFRSISSNIMNQPNILETISMTDGYRIKYIYPDSGVLDTLKGVNLLNIPRQRQQAIDASKTKQIVLDGPVKLIQEGSGIIGRQAFFSGKNFRGMISGVINISSLTEIALQEAKERGLQIAIRKTDSEMVYGSPRLFSIDAKVPTVPIMMFNLTWEMAGEPDGGFQAHNESEKYVHAGTFLLFVFAVVLLILKHRQDEQKTNLNTLLRLSQRMGQMGSFVYSRKKDTVSFTDEVLVILPQAVEKTLTFDDFIEIVRPDHREQLIKLFKGGVPQARFETEFYTSAGNTCLRMTAVSTHNINNEFSGYQGIIADVSEQKNIIEDLALSETRYRDLTLCTSDFIWEMDTDCHYTFFDGKPEHRKLMPQEQGAKPLFSDSNAGAQEQFFFCNTIVKNGLPIKDMEHWVTDEAGNRRCYLMNGVPVFDTAGKLTGYRGVDKDITEQYMLRLEREMIFRVSRDGLAIVDMDARFIDMNKAYLDMTGYDRDYLLTIKCYDITHPDDMDKSMKVLREVYDTGFYDKFEKRCRRKDGEYITVQMTLSVMDSKRILIASRDITEIRTYQNALEEKEKLLSSIIDVSPIPLCIMDKNGRAINVNRAFTDVFGYTLADVSRYKAWWTIIYPDKAQKKNIKKRLKKYIAATLEGYTPAPVQAHAVCKNKEIKDIVFHYAVLTDMAVAAFYDITSRVQAENKLQEYIKIVDTNIPISRTDMQGYITSVSEAFCQLCGFKKEELIGRRHEMLHHPDFTKELYDNLVNTIASGYEWEGELKKIHRDGSVFWTKTLISPIFSDGIQTGFMAIDQDITDKKRIEKMSVTDKLTGIYNRIRLDEVLTKEFARYKRLDDTFSVILFDIDHFKNVNDTYGHLVGDEVLKTLASIVSSSVRESDIFGRWGGEEFLIICPATEKSGAYTLAEKLREKVAAYDFPTAGIVTCSFGVAEIDIKGTDAMIKTADDALYKAKQSGRNRVEN